jgi:hypothetical protein
MRQNILTIMLLASSLFLNAQERCGNKSITKHTIEKYPQYKIAKEKVNAQIEKWIEGYSKKSEKIIITIPVVVHVVWNTNAENISDTRVYEQIEILNNDFRRTNIDVINTPSVWQTVAADCEIEFCLAQVNPNGNITTGINRVETNVSQFSIWGGSSVKDEAAAWSNDKYLNIWVCDLGEDLLGYALPATSFISSDDGVVINYANFGNSGVLNEPYHKGRTTTHEIGHWLNLIHIWGDNNCGDDQVTDTPIQKEENSGTPAFPHNANSCGTTNSNGDMFMNYMDYTNDLAMNLFTQGQKIRMISTINQYRPNMLTHNLCSRSVDITEVNMIKKELIKIVDILGREIKIISSNNPLFFIYNDGSVEKKIIVE